jgi:hypothetical protein
VVAVFDRPAGRATRPSRLSKLPAAAWDSSSFLWVRSELCCLDEVIEQNRGTGVLSAAATATLTASVLADSSAAAKALALLQQPLATLTVTRVHQTTHVAYIRLLLPRMREYTSVPNLCPVDTG